MVAPTGRGAGRFSKRRKVRLLATVLAAAACIAGSTTAVVAAPPRSSVGPAVTAGSVALRSCSGVPSAPGAAFALGTWPSDCWRPYADTSAFNLPVPAAVPAPTAAACGTVSNAAGCPEAGAVLGPPSSLLFDPNGWTGWPTYYVDPARNSLSYLPVQCTGDGGNGACDSGGSPAFPFPNGSALAIQYGNGRFAGTATPLCAENDLATDPPADCHITVVDTGTDIEHDLYATHTTDGLLRPATSSGSPVIVAGGSGSAKTTGTGQELGTGNGVAAGVGNLAGRLRLEEFRSAVAYENGQSGRPIGHALAITVPCIATASGSGVKRFPATAPDAGGRKCTSSPAPLMGTRFRLHPTAAQFAALPAWQRALVRAATTYGLVVMDIGSGVALELESGNQYVSAGGAARSPWFDYATSTLGWPVGGPPCSDWTGVADPSDPSDTANCPAVGQMNNSALTAVWATAQPVPECASFPGSNASACPTVRARPSLVATQVGGTPHARTVKGSNYPAGAVISVCEAPASATTCPAGAPNQTRAVGWTGAFTLNLTLVSSVGGKDCATPGNCAVLVPDNIWGRPTGRPVAKVAVTY